VTIDRSGREKQQVISSTISLRPHQADIGSRAIGGLGSFFIGPTKSRLEQNLQGVFPRALERSLVS
jgi:hypothetical protein